MKPSEDKIEVARRNCRDKCSEITLTNHKTAFNALNGLGEDHVKNLKYMGYSSKTPNLHDFGWTCKFDPENGVFWLRFDTIGDKTHS